MRIIPEKCQKCRKCEMICPVQAISEKDAIMMIDRGICIQCGCCAATCPCSAIDFE